MSASDDRHAGPNNGRISGQMQKIRNWMENADFEHVDRGGLDRTLARIDWKAEIDPTLSASANYQKIKQRLGLKTKTDIEIERRDRRDQEQARARHAVMDNLEAIEAGDAEELLADVTAEYGEAFVAEALDTARVDRDGAEAEARGERPAVEPNDHYPSAVVHANRSAMSDLPDELTADAEPEPTPAPAPEPTSPPQPETPETPTAPVHARALRALPAPVKLVLLTIYVFVSFTPDFDKLAEDATHA